MAMVESWNPAADGDFSEAALRRKLQQLGYQVSRYVYQPGTCFPDHTHAIDKIDAVVSGQFRMVIEGHDVVLKAGDMVAVPRRTVHAAEVIGQEPVVSLDATRE